ncbi:MAG TPA: hypothetical protein VJ570_10160 [Holophagaceae bacterium]|nr:hypothetical protein [Holophagaceae bacterium]
MPARVAPQPSPKLQSLLKEFQQIAAMAGFLNHGFDLPQLRMQFTLYGRLRAEDEAAALALQPPLQRWAEQVSDRLREDSSGGVLQPQILMAPPQPFPGGGVVLVVTLTFTTKVTDSGYFKVKTAVLSAYQEAVRLRESGLPA